MPCGKENETISHSFLHCEVSVSIWSFLSEKDVGRFFGNLSIVLLFGPYGKKEIVESSVM